MQPVEPTRINRPADSNLRARKRTQKNRYHRGAKASEYTTLKILRGFAEGRPVRDLASEMRLSEKTLRDIHGRLRQKLIAASLAQPTDFGRAGMFLYRDGRLSPTGHAFLQAVRESNLFRAHKQRHALRFAAPHQEVSHLIEVTIRVFCNISMDKSLEAFCLPSSGKALHTLKSNSTAHNFPSTVMFDHLRRYLLIDPL